MKEARGENRNGAAARRWHVRLREALVRPFTVLHGPSGKWSMLRLILATFVVRFTQKFPEPGDWTGDTVKVLAILVFALTVDTLMGRIPATEALGAVQAFFAAVTAKGVGAARDAYQSYRYQPAAPGEPPDEAPVEPPAAPAPRVPREEDS